MARAHFVKSARKDNPVAKKGESYYWWAFMQGGRGGPKRYSKTPPRRSQLTQSDFYSQLYDLEDSVGDLKPGDYDKVEDLQADLDGIKEQIESLGSEQADKLSNMPDGLQQGDSGQLLQERADACEALAQEFDGLDYSEPEDIGLDENTAKEESKKAAMKEAVEKRCEEIIAEADGFDWSIS